MNEIQIFKNSQFGEVRSVVKGGEPWFIAKDVCDCLGINNPTVAVSRLDDDERAKFNLGRQGETNVINEYGLYGLVLASRKPEAKEFKRWVTHEVIPAIRKTGMYMTDNAVQNILNNPTAFIEILTEYKKVQDENKSLTMQNASQKTAYR